MERGKFHCFKEMVKSMTRWPNLFLVGPPKTGTTSLYSYLDSVPNIFMSKDKEPHYFAQNALSKRKFFYQILDKKKYLKLFENAKNEKIIGEASTSYFGDPSAPELIKQASPNAYIIISLRDPVERIYSNYLQGFSMGTLKLSFHEEIEHGFKYWPDPNKYILRLQPLMHSDGVKRYLKVFDPKHVKILIFEEWVKDAKNTVNEIIRFLGLNYTISKDSFDIQNPFVTPRGRITQRILESTSVRKISPSLFSETTRAFVKGVLTKKVTKPKMDDEDRGTLKKFYKDDVKELEKILGQKLPWPNF